MVFENRKEAGQLLASRLSFYKASKPIILALPRGGIPIGFEVAKFLKVPLNVLVARKIGAPNDSEFGIGAISEDNSQVLNDSIIKSLIIPQEKIEEIIQKETEELKRRVKIYRNNKRLPSMKNKTVILVDDGLATGVTAHAAIVSIKKHQPKEIIFASPVCAYDSSRKLKSLVDKIICITKPVNLSSIGQWYKSFDQVSDEEVVSFLKKAR